ncbi:30S ribosomal protein S6 [Borrelia hermsii]|uniref:Small ribosomal subunit protein bS6 n=3 Tax=Borrelia hermsii TaxID=140 RepID=RS6_BORHD|nr:30S ribosomal protein S6 [Borrelia hermsii]B2S1U9.1 RecName: Full=Small ribosomal subunit protein bS6; AltName: Full=30S ribosomal protein S6 [Borrelia hermsii DAH]AAX16636.1 SSU ribosomal protein S6P [Borrelia hermsii DAH]AJW72943.1 30S ribosomal protein S6 [Borrelia hermsii CC1]AMR75701.1 30S ribosomal protein S6 [Borrelia hermsii]ANA42936.1 30S ribosomal protein S6 [Borrelia hermsii HS1]UCP01151.1 30S ribosomal protein S6 [Borrelia hermsii]
MIKKYEACFLFKSEELEYKVALEDVKKQLTAFNASDFVENSLGERALEYSIRKQSRGRYEIIEFKMDSSNLKELEVQLRLIKNLLRYMILVKINKKVNVKKVKRRNFREFKDNRDTREKELPESTADVKVD